MRRSAFTLIELLMVILIIGILSGLFYGAIQKANGVSKIAHTKSTIAKLSVSLMDRWDSYRSRRLQVDPVAILNSIKSTGGGSYPYVQAQMMAMSARRIAASGGNVNSYPTTPFDPLSVPYTDATGAYRNSAQIAAVRLLAMRELLQYEMPSSFADFADMSGTPGSFAPRAPLVLTTWPVPSPPYIPPVAQAYLRVLNSATTTDVGAITANQAAECLYMILTIGSTDSGLFGEQLPTAEVGDVDGDGLLEFQDAWRVTLNSYTPNGKANGPIFLLRWPAGYVSDVQPDQTAQGVSKFSLSHHDFFDPLKLDIPDVTMTTPTGRGFQLTPLIYSAGPDGMYEILSISGTPDPYDNGSSSPTPGLAGIWFDSNGNGQDESIDNVTNHELDTRTGR